LFSRDFVLSTLTGPVALSCESRFRVFDEKILLGNNRLTLLLVSASKNKGKKEKRKKEKKGAPFSFYPAYTFLKERQQPMTFRFLAIVHPFFAPRSLDP